MGFIKEGNRSKILIIYFLTSSMLEILAYAAGGCFAVMAAWAWMITSVILGILLLYYTGKQVYRDIKGKKYFVPLGFLVLVILFFSFIGNIGYADINPDAAQQTAAGLDSFSSADLNYTGKGFLGYPVRQYTIAAIPALLLGRNIWTLHAGFGLYFIVGLIVFFMGLRVWLKSKDMKEEYALLPCYSLLCFPFITEYYQNFEQAIIPVSLTMLAIGLYLKMSVKTDLKLFIAITWTGCLMADSYTPVLASMGLLIVFVLLLNKLKPAAPQDKEERQPDVLLTQPETDYTDEILRDVPDKKTASDTDELVTGIDDRKPQHTVKPVSLEKMVPVGAVFNIFVFFLATFIPGRSDRLTEFREDGSVIKSIFTAWTDFFTDANARFLGVFGGLVLLYIIFSIAGAFKLHDALLSLWVLAVVFISDYMTGYTAYEKCWILQRNMIVIPVLLTGIFIVWMYFLKKHNLAVPAFVQGIVLVLMLFAGLFNFSQQHRSFNYFRYIQPMKHLIEYVEDTLEEYGLKNTDEFNLAVYTDNVLEQNMYDYAKFFFPNASVYTAELNNVPEVMDEDRITFLYTDEPIPDDSAFLMFNPVVSEEKEFDNKRYDFKAKWYRYYLSQVLP